MTYSEKLKDPRWQRKKTQVWERDDYTCCACGTKSMTVHAHHLQYTGEPWDAPMEDLVTLCEPCHGRQKDFKRRWSVIGATIPPESMDCLLSLLEEGSRIYRNTRPMLKNPELIAFLMAYHAQMDIKLRDNHDPRALRTVEWMDVLGFDYHFEPVNYSYSELGQSECAAFLDMCAGYAENDPEKK